MTSGFMFCALCAGNSQKLSLDVDPDFRRRKVTRLAAFPATAAMHRPKDRRPLFNVVEIIPIFRGI